MRLGRQSGGLAVMSFIWPPISRLNPRTGFKAVAPISRHIRSEPLARLSSVSVDTRWSISPSVIPPRLVLNQSFGEGAQPSKNHSHIRLPPNAHGTDSQKLYPLARPAL